MSHHVVTRIALALVLPLGCIEVDNPDPPANDQEVITTVTLTFTPAAGAVVVAAHADPENDGAPVIDPITLTNGTTYALSVTFENELEAPAEDITVEVDAESADHQVIVYGDGVEGPATGANAARLVTHAYADEDENALPIGLENTVVAVAAGAADLRLMLRHLPPESDTPVKVATIASDFAAGGSTAIPGDVDADVTFPLTVE